MEQNVGQFLTRRARRDPSLEALVEPSSGRRFTFRELNARSNRVANALRELGTSKGERVGLLLMNGAEFVESFFAVGKAGAVNVPLNWRLVPDELEFILSDAGVKVLIYGVEFSKVAAELRDRGTTAIEHWIEVGGEGEGNAVDYDAWTAAASDAEPEATASGDDLLFIMYTSGTTGLPKGVMHSHHTVLWTTFTMAATADYHHGDRYLNSLPLFHVGALAPVIGAVYSGSTLVMMKAFDPTRSWELIGEEKIDTTLMVPAMLQFMLAVYDPEKFDLSRLRWIMSGAAPVPLSLIESYTAMGVEIRQVYGMTETCGPACLITSEDAIQKAGSTGRAFYFTEVRVVRPDGSDTDPGETGEVVMRGPHIMVGYWNRPEATAETIVDGWLHSGDVATMDEEGFVTIVDRVKDMLISGGENVYPAEIENVILGHPMVADVGVIGIPSKKWGESPLAVIVRSSESLTAQDVIDHCQGKLAPFKLVKAVEFVDEIPRNPSGKILKRELRERFRDDAKE